MATRAKQGSKNGIEWRTDAKGETTYRGVINTATTGKQNGPRLASHAEAKAWRVKALGEAQAGTRRRSSGITLREAWEAFYTQAKAGAPINRSGNPYKPSALRGYERGWKRVDPELGAHRLDSIRRADLQALIDRWGHEGASPATIRNRIDPVRTLYRRAMQRDQVTVNPTVNLELPRVSNDRDRFATREEAAALLAALPETERPLWATAFYGGLRRGELRGLTWKHVDLPGGLIRVQRGWDDEEGDQDVKSRASRRRVPIIPALHALLEAHRKTTARNGDDLVFGRSAAEPFIPSTVRNRALAAWKRENERRLEADPTAETLEPIGLHECRHTFASLMIAAGANAKALSVVMGHETIGITFDRYGKLMPGGEAEVGQLLGAYLEGAQAA